MEPKTFIVATNGDNFDTVKADSWYIAHGGVLVFTNGTVTRQGISQPVQTVAYAAGAWQEVWEDGGR